MFVANAWIKMRFRTSTPLIFVVCMMRKAHVQFLCCSLSSIKPMDILQCEVFGLSNAEIVVSGGVF